MKVIWFNQWFTTIYHTIVEFKKLGYYIVASSSNPDHIYLTLADNKIAEPTGLTPGEYCEWALKVCKENHIDYFFPKKMREKISERMDEFSSIGTTTISDSVDILNNFQSKDAVYNELHYIGINPEYKIATTWEELLEYIKETKSNFETCCMKLDTDEGGASFRVIQDESNTTSKPGITIEQAIDFYMELSRKREASSKNTSPLKMMVMPLLSGPEISADCLYTKDGLVCLARSKMNNRVQVVHTPEDVQKYCEKIQYYYQFQYPFNVQFRWMGEELKLLEINPRISGGIHMTFPTGIVIPVLAVDKSISIPNHKEISKKSYRISQLETPILLDKG